MAAHRHKPDNIRHTKPNPIGWSRRIKRVILLTAVAALACRFCVFCVFGVFDVFDVFDVFGVFRRTVPPSYPSSGSPGYEGQLRACVDVLRAKARGRLFEIFDPMPDPTDPAAVRRAARAAVKRVHTDRLDASAPAWVYETCTEAAGEILDNL